ncbi:hypothetical protein NFI96_000049 [Prochilodus magdalenae]|nr:hypothetical protein NFI96_000049 [Prochilodus magdalenae]
MGELLQCGCESTRSRAPPPRPPGVPHTEGVKWEWGGCGDDVEFGYEKSKQFMDARRRKGKSDIRTLIDLHNNEAGRLVCGSVRSYGSTSSGYNPSLQGILLGTVPGKASTKSGPPDQFFDVCVFQVTVSRPCASSVWGQLQAVKNYMRTECKCHGLSGSCTLRTCWKKMPHFREVGDRLLERFNGAFKVMGGNDGKTLIPVGHNIKPPDKQDLIYSAESPDFCLPNRKTGSLGTRGRTCNSTALDVSGCDLLCCERGHRLETVELEENCLCRFHWCCVVQCKKCSVRKELSLCL